MAEVTDVSHQLDVTLNAVLLLFQSEQRRVCLALLMNQTCSVSHGSSSSADTYKLELLTGSSKGNQSGTVEKINDKIIKDIHRLSHSTSWKEPKEKNNQIYVIILHSSKYETCFIMINTFSSSCCCNAGCITSCSTWFRKCPSQHMYPCWRAGDGK